MEITQQQAYEAALTIIGQLTVEQHFRQRVIEDQARKIAKSDEESPDADAYSQKN